MTKGKQGRFALARGRPPKLRDINSFGDHPQATNAINKGLEDANRLRRQFASLSLDDPITLEPRKVGQPDPITGITVRVGDHAMVSAAKAAGRMYNLMMEHGKIEMAFEALKQFSAISAKVQQMTVAVFKEVSSLQVKMSELMAKGLQSKLDQANLAHQTDAEIDAQLSRLMEDAPVAEFRPVEAIEGPEAHPAGEAEEGA